MLFLLIGKDAMKTINDIRNDFKYKLLSEDFIEDKSGVKLLEIPFAQFSATEESIFGTVNRDYVQREIAWYKSQSLNVNDIPGGPPTIWREVATPEGNINSNYGYLVFSQENGNQYLNVLEELRRQPTSRRALAIYTRPSMWKDYSSDGKSDFICTNTVQYLIRGGVLFAHVQMRSNDAIYGYKNDYAWQRLVLEKLAGDLQLPAGPIIWSATSLHIYERHFNLIKESL